MHPFLTDAPALCTICVDKLHVRASAGFCAVSTTLPLPGRLETELSLPPADNGISAVFGKTVHCVAAEPHEVFLRVGVSDGGREVAFESALLGRLRGGYRVLLLRSMLGTRIELAYLFVRIHFATELNLWPSPRQLRLDSQRQEMLSCANPNESIRAFNV